MFKRTILALMTVGLLAPAVIAQNNATFTLRSGETLSGELIDLGGVGFTITVNGQERRIPRDQVAIIDFAGAGMSDADWARVGSGQQVLWLRSGEAINGSLFDVAGSYPKKIIFRTDGGERTFSSTDVSRIVLARPNNVTSGTTGPGVTLPGGAGIAVQGNQQWTPTGITVRRGEVLRLNTTGEVQLSTDSADVASPHGAKSGRMAPGAPLPTAIAGALIGRIGNGRPFPVGGNTTLTAPAAGQLFLGINDDNVGDNQGGFRVDITRTGRR
jgi:hypothetical protein